MAASPTSRERELFEQALDLPSASDRDAFLARACAGDALLLDRIRQLLIAHEQAGRFLGPESSTPDPDLPGERTGDSIGPYRLLERIGQGGFAIVHLAEQSDPVRRRVALKILKPGMDSRQVVARFGVEREALALMDHPNIARVLDAGITAGGRPYFAMEFVNGAPMIRHCDDQNLGFQARLELFLQVCQAVHHAHQKGIIHRDLKPSNVLVAVQDGRPFPKVIDFGIAKATQPDLGGDPALTRFHEFLGTPAYMSPEQARSGTADVDTRADVYALGVLLRELLTGRTPLDGADLLQAGPEELRRRIREEEPPKPSARFAALPLEVQQDLARQRGSTPDGWIHRLRGEVDWVILKCLEKDRNRRYESANALADDIGRLLRDEAVAAARPGAAYRLRKFARRHRAALATGTALAALLLLGTIVSSLLAVRAHRAERLARDEAAIADAVNHFLNEDLFSQADPELEPDREIRLRTLLDRASPQIDARFSSQPRVAAAIHATLARTYENLGDYPAAERHLRRALTLHESIAGPAHPETVRTLSSLGYLLSAQRRPSEAIALCQRAADAATAHLGRNHPLTLTCLSRLAYIFFAAGDIPAARRVSKEAVDLADSLSHPGAEDVAQALHVWGRTLGRQGHVAEGELQIRRALDLLIRDRGEHHPQTLRTKNALAAYLYDYRTHLDEAERLYLAALDSSRRTLGETHPRSLVLRGNLVLLYTHRLTNRLADALHHQLKLIEFRPPTLSTADLPRLRGLMNAVPPDSSPELIRLPPDTWQSATNTPPAGWTETGHTSTQWTQGITPNAAELWLRHEFELAHPPTDTPFVLLEGSGDCSVLLNGVAASADPPRRTNQFQVVVCNARGRAALRAGRNVIGLHARNSTPDTKFDVRLLAAPPLSRASAEALQAALNQ